MFELVKSTGIQIALINNLAFPKLQINAFLVTKLENFQSKRCLKPKIILTFFVIINSCFPTNL